MRELSWLQQRATWPSIDLLSLCSASLNSGWDTYWPPGLKISNFSKLLHLPWKFNRPHFLLRTNEGLHRNVGFFPSHNFSSLFHRLLLRHEHSAHLQHSVCRLGLSGFAPHLLPDTLNESAKSHCNRGDIVASLSTNLLHPLHGGNLHFKAPQYVEDN